jgi:Initiator Replication protein
MSNDLIVIKSNTVNQFRYSLSREEQKLLLYVISQIREDEKIYKSGFEINIQELFKVLDLGNTGNKYKYLVKMTEKIMEPAVIEDEDGVSVISFFSIFKYNYGEGSLTVLMTPLLIDHFIDLKKQFIKYKLNNVMTMKSVYSIRLYEILKQNLYRGIVNFKLKDLRWKLNIDDKEYKRFADFRINVLDRAFEEINEKTDIKYTYKEIKIGKSIREIEFEINSNQTQDTEVINMTTGELSIVKPTLQQPKQIPNTPLAPTPNTPTTPKPDLLQKAKSLGIPDHLTNKWIDSKGIEKVDEKLELLIKRNKTEKIASPVGFFISAIQQDWQDETKETKLTEEEKRELRKESPETVMMEPLSFSDEVAFYEEMARLQNDFYIPRWAERDMVEAEQNWARVTA